MGTKPTMQDVADLAGVSRALVSLVFRDSPRVSDASRDAVIVAARELDYRPNAMARGLAARRSQTVGVVLNDLHNPFFADALDGIQSEADGRGYRVLIANGSLRPEAETNAVDLFLEYRPDGIILIGPRMPDGPMVSAAASTNIALVGRRVDDAAIDWVATDEQLGAELAVNHLRDLGHVDIAHIDGGNGAGAQLRRSGYEQAMTEAGLSDHIRVVAGDFTEASGVAGTEQLLHAAKPPTAIFAGNDLMAAGAVYACESTQHSVPRDVSIVGFDNAGLSAMAHLSITTIDQPRVEMGRSAMAALLERVEDQRAEPFHRVVQPSLVIRRTTAPPRPTI